jgi:hypothetical protein
MSNMAYHHNPVAITHIIPLMRMEAIAMFLQVRKKVRNGVCLEGSTEAGFGGIECSFAFFA